LRLYLAVALMFALYLLPWLVNPAVSLTPNGYELAEWTSLHPAVRGAEPPLLTSLLLRLPLVCLALVVAFTTRRGILPLIVVLGVVAALLPPELIQATDNPNSRQQGALALITLVGGLLGLSGVLRRFRRWVAVSAALVGALASSFGLLQSAELMRGFSLPAHAGIGGIALIAAFGVLVGILALNQTGQR
jgi:hypothetical protein